MQHLVMKVYISFTPPCQDFSTHPKLRPDLEGVKIYIYENLKSGIDRGAELRGVYGPLREPPKM